jgi:hypothetical protein
MTLAREYLVADLRRYGAEAQARSVKLAQVKTSTEEEELQARKVCEAAFDDAQTLNRAAEIIAAWKDDKEDAHDG